MGDYVYDSMCMLILPQRILSVSAANGNIASGKDGDSPSLNKVSPSEGGGTEVVMSDEDYFTFRTGDNFGKYVDWNPCWNGVPGSCPIQWHSELVHHLNKNHAAFL